MFGLFLGSIFGPMWAARSDRERRRRRATLSKTISSSTCIVLGCGRCRANLRRWARLGTFQECKQAPSLVQEGRLVVQQAQSIVRNGDAANGQVSLVLYILHILLILLIFLIFHLSFLICLVVQISLLSSGHPRAISKSMSNKSRISLSNVKDEYWLEESITLRMWSRTNSCLYGDFRIYFDICRYFLRANKQIYRWWFYYMVNNAAGSQHASICLSFTKDWRRYWQTVGLQPSDVSACICCIFGFKLLRVCIFCIFDLFYILIFLYFSLQSEEGWILKDVSLALHRHPGRILCYIDSLLGHLQFVSAK